MTDETPGGLGDAVDPDAAAVRAAARAIGWRTAVVSGLVVLAAVALTIAWVVHQSFPQEQVEARTDAAAGVALVQAGDVLAAIAVMGVVGVGFAGVVAWLISGRAVRPLGEALRRQRAFVADASHELRTPLAVLDARLQLVQRRLGSGALEADEQTVEAIDQLRRDSAVLVDVVGDLLLAAGADAEPPAEPVAVADVVHEVVTSMRLLGDQVGVALAETTRGHALVAVPRTALRRSLVALVDNAVAHSPAGGTVAVTSSVTRDHGVDVVVLTVADRGAGIAGVDPQRVFDRFARGTDASAGRPRAGFGLGLALVRDVVARHGGEVRVVSTSAEGTTMEVRLPGVTGVEPAIR